MRVSYVGSEGEERPILYAGPGTLLNVPSVIANDFSNSLAECVLPTEIAILDSGLITDPAFVKKYPELMINLVHSLCVHMVIHTQRLADDSLYGTLTQVCRVLREISSGREHCAPGLSQQELARLLGVHRATLTRAIFRLRGLGIIGKFTRNELEILDPHRLCKLADGE